jgi:hypothetical protein
MMAKYNKTDDLMPRMLLTTRLPSVPGRVKAVLKY